MSVCSFCGFETLTGTGFTLFKKDGTAIHYCSRKCERNSEMKRNPRRLKWTKKYASSKAQKKA